MQVRPGARVPADGRVVRGTSSLDDSPVTGESVPVFKTVGDQVFAGSINQGGLLSVEVEKTAADNTIARIIHMVEEAEASKAPTARFIDRFSRVYTPGVVAVSTLVAVIPPLLMGGEWHPWLYKGIALLLIGCPCALVLSVPAAITSGVSAGARRGLLIKGGSALEILGSVKTVAFDKTGTLTAGRPSVTDVAGFLAAVDLHLPFYIDSITFVLSFLIVSGVRTEQCCETTTRHASDCGYGVDFVTEATLTFPMIDRHGHQWSTDEIKARTELVLDGRFARVFSVEQALAVAGEA